MFYEQVVLAKKGPLGHVWLAAHWEKKITKQQVNDTNIVETVEQIRNPRAQMALRLSGHLLLGVVRIYHRKVEFLYTDCNEALGRLKKLVFSPGTVGIDESVQNLRNVTMPDTIGDFEVVLPGDISTQQLPDMEEGVFNMNVSKATDITLVPTERERMRRQSRRESVDRLQQPEHSLHSEMDLDLMDPNAAPLLDTGGAEDLLGGPTIEPGFEENPLGGGDWALELPAPDDLQNELAIPELPARARKTASGRGGRRRNYIQDKRTQLPVESIRKLIDNPSSLLRTAKRAPATYEALEQSLLEESQGIGAIFSAPSIPGLSGALADLITNSVKAVSAAETPQVSIDTSELEERRRSAGGEVERGGSPLRVEPGFQEDYDALPLGDEGEVPLPDDQFKMPAEEAEADEGERTAPAERATFVITKRTASMHEFLSKKFTEAGAKSALSFNTIFEGKSRHAAAVGFFELLNIKSKNCVDLSQAAPYADIKIKKTSEFNALTA